MEEKTCHKCHTTFSPMDHRQGFVVNDQFFFCEDCSQHNIQDIDVEEICSSKQILTNEMPIALWLIKEQNKGKTFMSARK